MYSSIKEQGALSPHKLVLSYNIGLHPLVDDTPFFRKNTSTGTCQVTNRKDMEEMLLDTYRDLYPLKSVHSSYPYTQSLTKYIDRRVYIASTAGISVMLTPLSWLTDGTYGDKPINIRFVLSSSALFCSSSPFNSLLVPSLLKDVITFAQCEDLKFINPARFPPSRLGSVRAGTTSSITYNLTTKELPMGPVSCITFGSVVDSHLFHPRVAVSSATHSITILPLHCEWERTLSCIGNALGESALSHYIYMNGVSYQGQWAKPSEHLLCLVMFQILMVCSRGDPVCMAGGTGRFYPSGLYSSHAPFGSFVRYFCNGSWTSPFFQQRSCWSRPSFYSVLIQE